MMRYRLRTLMIVLALGPPMLAYGYQEHRRYQFRQSFIALERSLTLWKDAPSEDEWRRFLSKREKVRCRDISKE